MWLRVIFNVLYVVVFFVGVVNFCVVIYDRYLVILYLFFYMEMIFKVFKILVLVIWVFLVVVVCIFFIWKGDM